MMHIPSRVVHLDIIVGAAVNLVILGAEHLSHLYADRIPCRVEPRQRHMILLIFRKVYLQLAAETLPGKCPQLVFQRLRAVSVHAQRRNRVVDAQQLVRLVVRISHKCRTVSSVLQNGHGQQCVQVFLAAAWNPLVLHQGMAHAGRELPLLGNLGGAELMARRGKCVAVVDVHHFLRRQIIFHIIDKPVRIHLRFLGAVDDPVRNRLCLLVGDLIHIFENFTEGKLDHFETIPLTQHFRIADQALDTEGGLSACGEHKRPGLGHSLPYP